MTLVQRNGVCDRVRKVPVPACEKPRAGLADRCFPAEYARRDAFTVPVQVGCKVKPP
ncbi:hypothetical protein [Loktanella fryxellensis]|uniref:hypothetical protein n=1 Tax=Loktanella fryxellensis TaxID=245187 RepID=UPI0015A72597|nr:hypothetical protein [Loktanella fryxellensis]